MSQPQPPRVLLSWSTGKDSAWMLHQLTRSREVEVVGLLTTVSEATGRVAVHGVPRKLLEAQAEATGLPLQVVPLPWPCSNERYEAAMRTGLEEAQRQLGITHVAFGDLFLEDIRAYREKLLEPLGLTPLFPLWGLPTRELAREMVAEGLRAVLTSIDPGRLDPRFAGRTFDADLLEQLPPDVDPCGESGEFHTFVYAGPMFSAPLPILRGETVERDGFLLTDVS